MSAWSIHPLNKNHHRNLFDCGEQSLNLFLHNHAGQNAKRDISRTYVATPIGLETVAGYYTLSSGSVSFDNLPDEFSKRLPRYPVPTAHLGRLAVDLKFQRRGLGGILLVDALKCVIDVADRIGIHAVTVDAIHAEARQFYLAHGFQSFSDNELHLFLPMATIRKLA